ncbi:transposase [Frankia sp. CiP3]|uniref:transposase n=1 Tax=Frankia sp. CiP3 TaxID=2880971 RepID=UPI001EF6DE43|nr:transposase [Frankia sp. CiP3]
MVIERAEQTFPDWDKPVGQPRSLSLLQALKLTLCRLRRNATYQDLHEDFEIGRTTAWEYDQTMVEFLAREFGYPDDEDREKLLAMVLEGTVCLIDGTLVPTFNWKHRTDLLSGKHRRHGVTIQLFVDLHGRLICASLAFPGSWHDIHCFREAGLVDVVAHAGGGRGIGDLGYGGEREAVSTPIKKKSKKDLADVEKDSTQSSQNPSPRRVGSRPPEELADPGHALPQRPRPHRHRRPGGHWTTGSQRVSLRPTADVRPG